MFFYFLIIYGQPKLRASLDNPNLGIDPNNTFYNNIMDHKIGIEANYAQGKQPISTKMHRDSFTK